MSTNEGFRQTEEEKLKNDSANSTDSTSSSDQSFGSSGVSAFSEERRTDDDSLGGGDRGKDIEVSGGSAYGDGQTEYGGAGRLNDDSYSHGEEGGSTGESQYAPIQTGEVESTSADLAGREREIYP